MLSNSLPVIDELVKRSSRYVQKCLSTDSYTAGFIASYGVIMLGMFLPIGQNIFFWCCLQCGVSTDDLMSLIAAEMHKQCRSSISCEIVSVTLIFRIN